MNYISLLRPLAYFIDWLTSEVLLVCSHVRVSESSDPRVLTYEGHIIGQGNHSGEDRRHFLPVMISDSGEAGVS